MQGLARGDGTELFTYLCQDQADFLDEFGVPTPGRYQTVRVDPDRELQRLLLPKAEGLWVLTGRLTSQRDYLTRIDWVADYNYSPSEYVRWQLQGALSHIGQRAPVFFGGDDRLPEGVAAILHAHSNYLEWRDTPTRQWLLAASIPVTVRMLYNPRTLDPQRLDLGITDFPRTLDDSWPR